MRERYLRRYERMAQKEHWCDKCCNYIFPGDLYFGRVLITLNNNLMVLKQHIFPICQFPEEPKDENKLEELVKEEIKHAA